MEWQPSFWARLFRKAGSWILKIENDQLVVSLDDQLFTIPPEDFARLKYQRGLLWTNLKLWSGRELHLVGLSHFTRTELDQHLHAASSRHQFRSSYARIMSWLKEVDRAGASADAQHRWFTRDMQHDFLMKKNALGINSAEFKVLFDSPVIQAAMGDNKPRVVARLRQWSQNWPDHWKARNEAHMARELDACEDLLNRVETRELNDEQAKAAVCFDNRVQLIASAGSGKTSTMVAKAIYAVHRGLVAPSEIIMLAFNKDAAEELKERAAESLERLEMTGITINAMTFHSLGLEIIGGATGKKPNVPKWATKTELGLEKLGEIVDSLKDRSDEFRTKWDMFRLVFGRDHSGAVLRDVAEAFDRDGEARLITLNGEHVASQQERLIANWLFYNGVEYLYERPYEHDTATAERRQYVPDFFYPQLNLYHEHFAFDGDGQAPEHFKGYADDAAWKRDTHTAYGTKLIESTSHQINTGEIFAYLTRELTSRGVVLDPNPDRPIPSSGLIPLEHLDVLKVLRSFISHYKSNSLTAERLYERYDALPLSVFKFRYKMFLEFAVPVIEGWDEALEKGRGIDFEDMINLAANHLEHGYPSPYRLVMADEYQDASRARARLCRALVQAPHSHLFAVGDDWQSINRFAGADVSVMTGFVDWYGHGQIFRLEKTYRCPQAICDASSQFVAKNPAQLQKTVISVTEPIGPVFSAFQVGNRDELSDGVRQYLDDLYRGLSNGHIPPAKDRLVSVFVLGRYKNDEQFVPKGWKHRYGDRLDIRFKTIHTSKGDQAEYVILPSMVVRGFPSLKGDDPVFSLVMPEGDTYLHGEERRLFYVALTRACRSVTMFTVMARNSPFLTELVDDGVVAVTDIKGEPIKEERCPVCKHGVVLPRTGTYGDYKSCSGFPVCKYKPKKEKSPGYVSPKLRKR
ncbi:UvrD-helicase domain-containing protein [Pseudomonas sp. ADAK2]|uniref:UvrD-helicase domain-containing protein n=1 Tax=unclassified Pseudomonas TaxID=196821 RepID=UPI0014647E4F|nr:MULTISPECIES: UvrD-helicase domain-containing protein [unclassified Pseudomonas]QJI41069.1 UvrD-helicase domain-containing protein [Pseudomonas sp. ADAK7]QJI47374.1 UvrD-helicase domain-containing protein [Pseudomonas sp. ADAK2]